MTEEELLAQQQQQQQTDSEQQQVQSGQSDQGEAGEEGNIQQQIIDYEKAYRNLEPEFTKKSQELSGLKAWKDFQERTGITAEQALQQLDQYQGPQQQQQVPVGNQGFEQQQMTGMNQYQDPYSYGQQYEDPRVAQLEQQMQQMQQQQQVDKLRQRFPQFDEMYPDVMNLAQSQGLDLETAFGKLMVDRWDDVKANTEKQVVDRIRSKGLKSLESSNTSEQAQEPQLTDQEISAAQAMGISPQDYAQMKNVKYTID